MSTNWFIIIIISIKLSWLLIKCIKNINWVSKFEYLFNHIASKILSNISITNNYKILYYFIIEIKLTHIYFTKLFLILTCLANKYNNVIKLANWTFFLSYLKLLFYFINRFSTNYFCGKNLSIFSIQKN